MAYHSRLECVRGCGRRYSIYDIAYRCEDCGGLLDVVHDVEALRDRSAVDLVSGLAVPHARGSSLTAHRSRPSRSPLGTRH